MGALEDAIGIFKCFDSQNPTYTQAELARKLDRPKATVHRALKALVTEGMLEYDSRTREYGPGLRIFELAQVFRSQNQFFDALIKKVQRICDACGHTAYITVFDGPDLMVLRMLRGPSPVAIATLPGYKATAHSTSNGRAMLALLSEAELAARLPLPWPYVSPKTPTNFAELRPMLDEIRQSGISLTYSETYEGVASAGTAVRDPDTNEIYGIAVSLPASMMTEGLVREIRALYASL